MKICILQGYALPIPPVKGGAVEKLWYVLGQEFAKNDLGIIHISRLWSDFPSHEIVNKVEYRRIRGYRFQKNIVLSKLLDLVYTLDTISSIPFDTDIILTNTFWAPILLPIFRRAKIIVSVERMPKGQLPFYKRASIFRAPSNVVAQKIRNELPVNQWDKVVIIPNPLPYKNCSPLLLDRKEPVILYCGRIHPEKGVHLLEETAKELPIGWKLLVVGPSRESEGGGGKTYFESLQKLFIDKRVEFTGPVYNEEKLKKLYEKASIFVYPSIAEKGESFGLAPLEAMAFGCVPVVSDLECFKDFISDGENGEIFNHKSKEAGKLLKECISELINDENMRNRMAQKAMEVRFSHSSEIIADQFISLFNKMLDTKKGGM